MRIRSIHALLLLSVFACDSKPGKTPDSHEPAVLEADWVYEAPGAASGVLVRPDGSVVLAVAPHDEPFQATGGAMIFNPEGDVLAEIPMEIPPRCEGCTVQMFFPNPPLLMPDGSVILGDFTQNNFRLGADDGVTHLPWSDPEWQAGGIVGVSDTSAPAPDEESILLCGTKLVVLGGDGAVRQAIDFGHFVHRIVHLGATEYLLVLSEFLGEPTILATWDASTGEREDVEMPHPIAAVDASEGWIVVVLDLGLGNFALLELEGAWAAEPLLFELPAGDVKIALHAGNRYVAVGSGGVAWGDDKRRPTVEVGGTVIADMETGGWMDLGTSSVKGLAFDRQGTRLFVADTGGLRTFALE